MTGPVNLVMDSGGPYAFFGYVAGFAQEVNTAQHMDAVIQFTHATLAQAFNKWMDTVAKANPSSFMHVYEWPSSWGSGDTPDYRQTVGQPGSRLWKNTLSGRGANRTASFQFLASKKPSPVNPILTSPGKSGGFVKEGIHIFTWKAPAMEYGMDITVTPKLAKYLAYVHRESAGAGHDSGVQHIDDQGQNPSGVTFSHGPVHFTAGGSITHGQFTQAFLLWWSSMAQGEFDDRVRPVIEQNLIDEQALGLAIRRGNTANKAMKLSAQASKNSANFQSARADAIANLRAKANRYIEAARARRELKYGEIGWEGE